MFPGKESGLRVLRGEHVTIRIFMPGDRYRDIQSQNLINEDTGEHVAIQKLRVSGLQSVRRFLNIF